MELTEKQLKELGELAESVANEAKKVVKDYANDPSQISGSTIRIHEDSPFLDDNLKFNQWKHVTKGSFLDDAYKSILSKKSVDKKKKK